MSQLRDESASSGSLAGLAIADVAATVNLQRIQMVAWRDLDDPEAGGSELHAAKVAHHWAAAGLQVGLRTSTAASKPPDVNRDGYRVARRSGRYGVFPRVMLDGMSGRLGDHDAMVEIWNGMPFFSPLWSRKPTIVFLHHVHAEMWKLVLSKGLAHMGWFLESRVAPKLYRHSRIVTLSESSRDEIVDLLGLPPDNISVVPPGIDPAFSPGGARSADPLVVAVGRLVRVKRFDLFIEAVSRLKSRYPTLRAVVVGEGSERAELEAHIGAVGAQDWISLPGRVDDRTLVDLYRSAWLLASCSQREGWGMTITEAAACGTPTVASDIAGHRDAVIHGRSGFLAGDVEELAAYMDAILSDGDLRAKLVDGALRHASRFSWEATARGTFEVLALEVADRTR